MGVARSHFKGIFSTAATQWQIVLHSDVVAHTTTIMPKSAASERKYYLLFALCCLKSMWTWLLGTSTEPLGAAHCGD